ncbi:MAG TPA: transposase [Ignavibacteriales bacterium]|nr:transposase [Ignavibacteriales bacterium]
MKKIDYHIPLYKDHLYHVYNRGNGKEQIFFNEGNYDYFLRQYHKYTADLLDTFAYCLLSNHFHLLLRPKVNDPDLISEQFRKFFIAYSMAINKQEKRKGNLFQRAFKRKIIEDEKYFYSAVYYIHSNPVHHGFVKDLTTYRFSSFNSLVGNKETKLCRNEVMEWFGGKKNFIEFHTGIKKTYFSDNYIIEDDK